ncbi:hypothetical protein A9K97_gp433 [Tokyovirus A1]|uniref:hypothetical protein n=1 Tax=Tokyovirus A1 TaxID=1826170 RepID=UPI0007A96D03|nr:hypothetical protein A9K97_gp433 [Tokyovirus A1]BAU79918.1 hypothetical protein [Tokyovirus A1]
MEQRTLFGFGVGDSSFVFPVVVRSNEDISNFKKLCEAVMYQRSAHFDWEDGNTKYRLYCARNYLTITVEGENKYSSEVSVKVTELLQNAFDRVRSVF